MYVTFRVVQSPKYMYSSYCCAGRLKHGKKLKVYIN